MQERNDKAMMSNPDLWPNWPYLPIKRPHAAEGMQCAMLFATLPPVVILSNLFDTSEDKKNAERVEYSDIDAVLNDNWVVD